MPPKINRLGAALPGATQIEDISSPGDIIFDCLGYTFLSVQVFGTGATTIQTSISNDKLNWVGVELGVPNLGAAIGATPLIWARNYVVSNRYVKLTFTNISSPPLKVCGFLSSGAIASEGSLATNTSYIGTSVGANLKTSPGNVYAITCSNSGSDTAWFQLFEKASTPILNDIPVRSFPVYGNDGFLVIGQEVVGSRGIVLNTGVAWGLSSTRLTYTPATISSFIVTVRWS